MNENIAGINGHAISILGSTGSVGTQTLEVAESLGIRVLALSARRSTQLLEEQTRKFKPRIVALYEEAAAHDFKIRVRDMDVAVYSGTEGMIEAATARDAHTMVSAVVGMAGLLPTMAAIETGRRIAIANKETLVCAGQLVMSRAEDYNAQIIPVDSEHSAIFQCLNSEPRENVKRIILTASGGPFLNLTKEELETVTPTMALNHPTWRMGSKISIDSATMMNKGLEVIEAVHLFGLPVEKIEVVVHPQSIVHSMVEFCDSSIIAQLATPDMRLPIHYALTYPNRVPSLTSALDLTSTPSLSFRKPEYDLYPCLRLAIETTNSGGCAGAILNGANEAAVELFLDGRIGFYDIYESVNRALESISNTQQPTVDDIVAAGEEAYRLVHGMYS